MIDPGEGYRLLVEGEKIAEGDEFYDRVTCKWRKLGKLFAEIEWSAKGYANVRRKLEQQKDNNVADKLPEVGEFWDSGCGYRRLVLFRDDSDCLVRDRQGDWEIQFRSDIKDNWTYLPWCKSFDDAEPKPVTETVEFREYICGQEIKWLSWAPADAIPTGLVRQVKVKK